LQFIEKLFIFLYNFVNHYLNFYQLSLSLIIRINICFEKIYTMQIKRGLEIRNIAGEKVLIMQGHVGIDMTKIVSFNETAEWLWNTLYGETFSQEDVTRLLTERFQVNAETAETDAKKWMDQLIQCNAIE